MLKLSDSYIRKQENPSLELKVRFLNINQGKNAWIMEQCKELKEYMMYVDRVRSYLKDRNLETAVALAVDECIKEGRAEGHAEGLIEGGIETLILDNLEEGKSVEQILGKLEKRFGLSREVAKKIYGEIFCSIRIKCVC